MTVGESFSASLKIRRLVELKKIFMRCRWYLANVRTLSGVRSLVLDSASEVREFSLAVTTAVRFLTGVSSRKE